MKRYFVFFQFKGTNYHGWQIQPNANTVQAEMEKVWQTYFQKVVPITAAGRTDTGVHAKEMVAHFEVEEEVEMSDFIFRINNMLADDISIDSIREVETDFHARFDASKRTYEYYLSAQKKVFAIGNYHRTSKKLDFEKMNRAAQFLLGAKDFSCFSKSKTQTFTNDCEIFKAEWIKNGEYWIFEIQANRFLRNMVRAIVGTLIEVGQGRRDEKSIEELIQSKNRSKAGVSVPAEGLYLTSIEYPDQGFK